MNTPRSVDLARCFLGILALARPETVLTLSRGQDTQDVRRVVRVLGGRYLLQATFGSALHRRWVPAADAGVDLVHALSMIGLARWSPRHRRLAGVSAAAALIFAAADLADGRRPPATDRARHGTRP